MRATVVSAVAIVFSLCALRPIVSAPVADPGLAMGIVTHRRVYYSLWRSELHKSLQCRELDNNTAASDIGYELPCIRNDILRAPEDRPHSVRWKLSGGHIWFALMGRDANTGAGKYSLYSIPIPELKRGGDEGGYDVEWPGVLERLTGARGNAIPQSSTQDGSTLVYCVGAVCPPLEAALPRGSAAPLLFDILPCGPMCCEAAVLVPPAGPILAGVDSEWNLRLFRYTFYPTGDPPSLTKADRKQTGWSGIWRLLGSCPVPFCDEFRYVRSQRRCFIISRSGDVFEMIRRTGTNEGAITLGERVRFPNARALIIDDAIGRAFIFTHTNVTAVDAPARTRPIGRDLGEINDPATLIRVCAEIATRNSTREEVKTDVKK